MRFDEFLKEREYLLGVSPKTLVYYRCAFNSWTKHATDGTVLTWITGMKSSGLSNISINTYICAMRAYFKWAEPQRPKIAYLKEEEKLLQVFTPADITKIIRFKARSQTMKRIQALALLLADTGLRISEALSLTESDIDIVISP